jgi:uncharacterized protein YfaS (alpha-2-macroglobulin family)
MFGRRILLSTVILGGIFAACFTNTAKDQRGAQPASELPPQQLTPVIPPAVPQVALSKEALEKLDGLLFALREGREKDEAAERPKVGTGEPLSDDAANALLARVKTISAEKEDEQPFALREGSLPAPKTGKTIKDSFPPKQTDAPLAPDEKNKKLEVLRSQPTGEVPIARDLSVTFSLPMVPVTSHDDLAKRERPVTITPEPKGKWRWIGTKTILFEPEVRFPMATEYKVEIAAGTKAMNGAALAKAVQFTFTTPSPQVRVFHPTGGPSRRDPLMYVSFDQRIDPEAILAKITVKAGGKQFKIVRASAEEIAADTAVSSWSAAEEPSRWVAFRATELFPADTEVQVAIGPGAPSAEGPRPTKAAENRSFRTYAPLKITESRCGWGEKCSPYQPLNIWFNNPLDVEVFDEAWVKIEPEIPGRQINVGGGSMSIYGKTKGRTKYTVRLDPALKDQFGQTLGSAEERTFSVGTAEPMLAPIGEVLTVIDPSGKAEVSFQSMNYSRMLVRIFKARAEDYPKFLAATSYDQNKTPPGTKVRDDVLKVGGEKDEMQTTSVDLGKHLGKEGVGHLIVEIRPPSELLSGWQKQNPPRLWKWVQVTRLGVSAFVDNETLVPWITLLADGKPVAGAQISVPPYELAATAGSEGMVEIPLPAAAREGLGLVVARLGEDSAFVAEQNWAYAGKTNWVKTARGDYLRYFIFDDRGMYRPGEKVRIKGWVRRGSQGKRGDIGELAGAAKTIEYRVNDSRGNEIAKGKSDLNGLGAFYFELDLPKTVNLGHTSVVLSAKGGNLAGQHQWTHSFQVQEFRRPEFEVSASSSAGPHVIGGKASATVNATYYAGGGLANAETNWNVSATAGSYSPPNRSDYTFGTWTPWWGWFDRGEYGRGRGYQSPSYKQLQGHTDSQGAHHLEIDFQAVNPARAMTVTANATVMDVNRQAWSASTTMLVHPASVYVGLKTPRPFVQEGQPLVIDALAVDIDGKAVAERPITVRSVRLEWKVTKGRWAEEEVDEKTCALSSKEEAQRCELKTTEGGRYKVTATILDENNRKNQSEIQIYVAGGKTPPDRGVAQEKVELVPDKKDYRPGDTAEILVRAPFAPAEGIMTMRRSGIIKTERFTMSGTTQVLNVKLEDAHVPNVYVQVDLVGAAPRAKDNGEIDPTLPKRPAYATGNLNLPVPPVTRTLKVSAVPKDMAIAPGGETSVMVNVVGPDGQPAKDAEVTLVVVDESVLALSSHRIGNPLDTFYSMRGTETRDYHSRAHVWLATPTQLAESRAKADGVMLSAQSAPTTVERSRRSKNGESAPMKKPAAEPAMRMEFDSANIGDEEAEGGQSNEPIALRTNFDALAVFAAAVPTDSSGRAEIKVKVPDNLTRYRITALAVQGGKSFGLGESTLTARKPLMIRPSAPRFLNFGDTFEFPVILQNQTDKAMNVEVAMRATNASLTKYRGLKITVPATDRVEVRFPASAAHAGTARFQIVGASGKSSDAAELSLPVWTPATTEAFAVYGEIDDANPIKQPVAAPANVVTQFGGLEITTASTQLQALTDAVLHLVSYPYECSEQLSSRVIAVAAMKDVLNAFEAEGMPPPKEVLAAVDRDLERLQGMQNYDGGMPFWKRGGESWPFNTIHVAHAFARAKSKKFKVPENTLAQLHQYLKSIESRYPSEYGPETRRTLTAYALYVRELLDDPDPARARSLIAEAGGVDKIGIEALGWLYPTLSASKSEKELTALRRYFGNRVTETAGTAHFVATYGDGAHLLLYSDRRADGLILDGLIRDQPKSDLIAKIVRGLLAHRKKGHWSTTQENVWVLLAFDRYFHTYEGTPPAFVARAWIDDKLAGEHSYRGRSTEQHLIEIPMSYLAKQNSTMDLTLAKQGSGRMYYRIGMKYAPQSLKLEAAEHGFTVERRYEAVDSPSDVKRDADGTWRVRAGAKVRVRVSMVAEARRYHVALVDPLPAGFEAMNSALAVTGDIPAAPSGEETPMPRGGGRSKSRGWYWWWGPWYEHENLRDERVEAFTSLLWEGVHNYDYVARATTPGDFVVPPAKAEEMYAPETFGRSASDRVIVE